MLRCVELKLGSIADSEDCRPIGLVNSAATLLFVHWRVNKFTVRRFAAFTEWPWSFFGEQNRRTDQ